MTIFGMLYLQLVLPRIGNGTHRAILALNMIPKFTSELLQESPDGHGTSIAQRTNRVALDIVTELEQQLDVALLALSALDAF